ncbi:MAG: hypothetical protein ACRELE_06240 [Gemmatimonadales bacterium]
MSEETVVAESSSAETADAFNGENVSLAEFSHYRSTGELPEQYKADIEEATASDQITEAGEAESPKKSQESKRKPDAEQRIKQLTDEVKRWKSAAEAKAKPSEAVQPQQTRSKPTAEDKQSDGTPKYATYEDFVEELSDWKAEQRWTAQQREVAEQAQRKELDSKVSDAKQRYGEDKFDEVLVPTVNIIINDKQVSPVIKEMLNDSEVLPDLLFTIGSDEKELASFLKMAKEAPGKALRYLAAVEAGIIDELATDTTEETGRNEAGQFISKGSPVKPKTGAPKPPSPVTGASSGAFDVSDESLSSEEWARKRTADLNKRKG